MIDTNNLPKIIFYKFLFNLEFIEDALLPEFKGSTFRGATGWHLKKAVANLDVVYKNIFETEGNENNLDVLKGVKKIPHPFIIHPPITDKKSFKEGEIITIGLTLFGYAYNFLPLFIEAYNTMGKAGITFKKHKFKLMNVLSEDYDGSKHLVYENGSTHLSNKAITFEDIIKNVVYSADKIKLIFETPFLLQDKSIAINEENKNIITPQLLVSNIERRYKILSHYFCRSGTNVKKIFEPGESVIISKLNVKNYKMIRYSNKLKEKQSFNGLIGSITLERNLKPILPLFYLGEKINIGKRSSFGWGQYKIEIPD